MKLLRKADYSLNKNDRYTKPTADSHSLSSMPSILKNDDLNVEKMPFLQSNGKEHRLLGQNTIYQRGSTFSGQTSSLSVTHRSKSIYSNSAYMEGLATPGPGAHNHQPYVDSFGRSGLQFSLRPKNDPLIRHLNLSKLLPGPGSYTTENWLNQTATR